MRYIAAILFLWCATLVPVEAAVTISEVAWMGDTVSANNEWIELYNNGDVVALDGWVLTDGNNLSIALSGTVDSGAYVVLERNRADGQYLRTPPFFIYTGALVNSGATLKLTRADGSTEDQVAGGADWESIGGNNETKDTAQYTAVGWRTGPRTPGASNTTSGTVPGTPTSTSTTATTTTPATSGGTSGGSTRATDRPSETVRLVIPNVSLKLEPSFQATAYVNQTVAFGVTASGIGETWLDSLEYSWNFGDLSTSSGKTPTHRYRYPGTYVVTVEARYGRHQQIARQEITVLPVTLALARGPGGEVLLHNNAPYDVDVSGYRLEGMSTQVFPSRSIMGPKSTITLPPLAHGGGYYTRLTLRDTARAVVAQWPDTVAATVASIDTPVVSLSTPAARPQARLEATLPRGVATVTPPTPAHTVVSGVPLVALPVVEPEPTVGGVMPAYVRAALAEESTVAPDAAPVHWPYLALGAILMLAIGGTLVTGPKMSSSPAKIDPDV